MPDKPLSDDPSYVYVDTLDSYETMVSVLQAEPALAIDTETYVLPQWRHLVTKALDPHTSRISLLGLQGRNTVPVLFDILLLERQEYDRRPMFDLLSTREQLLGAYIQFDLGFLKRHYGVIFENAWDVQVMSKLIANATGSKFGRAHGHSLADLCRDWLDVHITGKGKEQVSDWYARPPADATPQDESWQLWTRKLKYAANDLRYLFPLHDAMLPTIINPLPQSDLIPDGATQPPYGLGMADTLELENQSILCAAEMTYNGLPASREIFTQLQDAIKNEAEGTGRLNEVAAELCRFFNLESYPSAWSDYDQPGPNALSALNNPQKLKALINGLVGTQLDNAQAGTLGRLVDLLSQVDQQGEADFLHEEEEATYQAINDLETSAILETSRICKLVVEYKKLFKLYGMDLRKFINPVTGCIHGRIDTLGAATGRSSSSAPNLQQVSGRTYLTVERPLSNLFPSSANYAALEPDWSPTHV